MTQRVQPDLIEQVDLELLVVHQQPGGRVDWSLPGRLS